MGERMAGIDWSRTSLGPVAGWPHSLQACVRIVLTSREPMFLWWGDSFINLYNDAFTPMLGSKHPAALAQPAALVWREVWDRVGPRTSQALLGNRGTYEEALLLLLDRSGFAEETYYTFSYSPVPDDDGVPRALICATIDDTRKVVGERRVATLHQLAAKATDAHDIGEACLRAAAVLAGNPHDLPFAAIYLPDDETGGMRLAAVTSGGADSCAVPERVDPAETDSPLLTVMRTREIRRIDDVRPFGPLPQGAWPTAPREMACVPILAAGPTGRAGVLLAGLNPFRRLDDDYRAFLGLITGQISAAISNAMAVRLREALYLAEELRLDAVHAVRVREDLLAVVSHDLRNPLSTVLMGAANIERIADESPTGTKIAKAATTIVRAAERMSRLIGDLLDLAKLEAGQPLPLEQGRFDLQEVVQQAVDILEPMARARNLTLAADVAGPLLVFCDGDRVQQVLANLVGNAIKFTGEGGAIAVSARRAEGEITVSVSDNGTGIPDDQLPHIFEPYWQADARRKGSAGLGLSIVKAIVEGHGGQVWVETSPGKGSTFYFTLSAADDAAATRGH